MGDMERNDKALVLHEVPGRGGYGSYKHVFMHVATTMNPDSLPHIVREILPEMQVDDNMEDFDLVALIAWWKSCAIYAAFCEWEKAGDPWYILMDRFAGILGPNGWAPSREMLRQGAFL